MPVAALITRAVKNSAFKRLPVWQSQNAGKLYQAGIKRELMELRIIKNLL
jgi:hypothetical protein